MDQIGAFILNHWGLWLVLLVVLVLVFINELLSMRQSGQELSPASAVDKINHDNACVIDLRGTQAFRAGHIIHAIAASAEDFTNGRMDKYKTKPLILVCERGLQSQSLAAKLRGQGFTNPMVLSGGLSAWTAANLPVVKGKKT